MQRAADHLQIIDHGDGFADRRPILDSILKRFNGMQQVRVFERAGRTAVYDDAHRRDTSQPLLDDVDRLPDLRRRPEELVDVRLHHQA